MIPVQITTHDVRAEERERCVAAIALLRDQADTEWGKENGGRSEGAAYNRCLAYVRAMEAICALTDNPPAAQAGEPVIRIV